MLELNAIPIVDQHAHNLLRPEEVTTRTYLSAFTEGHDVEVVNRQVRDTLFFRRSRRDLAAVLDCEPDLEAILAVRARLGFDEVAARCFQRSGFEALLLDDGFLASRTLPVAWHNRFAPAHRLLRVETLAESLLAAAVTWSDFQEAFRASLRQLPPEVVGLKSIVAYRTGLRIAPLPTPPDAERRRRGDARTRRRGDAARQGDEETGPFPASPCPRVPASGGVGRGGRLAHKPINDWVVWAMLEEAASRGMPVQFHTGFGDPDLDLRLANPLHLRPILENPALRGVPIVLLHAGYPFTREAGYLAAVYPNVYVDLGLAIPFLSVAGMGFVVRSLLELVPLTKILFSTDAHVIPELFYLGARSGRQVLAAELERAVLDHDLTAWEAEEAADLILRSNAIGLYGLKT